jgi:hypothetical protein
MAISFVHTILSQALADWSSRPFADVELALFLLHAMVETKANLPGTPRFLLPKVSQLKKALTHFLSLLYRFTEATQKTLEVFFAQAVAALVASGSLFLFSMDRSCACGINSSLTLSSSPCALSQLCSSTLTRRWCCRRSRTSQATRRTFPTNRR